MARKTIRPPAADASEGKPGAAKAAQTAGTPERPAEGMPQGTGGGGTAAPAATHTEGADDAGQPAEAPIQPPPGDADEDRASDEAAAAPAGEAVILPGANAPAAEPPAAVMLVVTGPRKGRWRAGRHFGPEPVTLVAADLTEAERAQLMDDPVLTVTVALA